MTAENTLVQIKGLLHNGGSMVLPGIILFAGASLLVHRHATSEAGFHEEDPLRTFLALIIIQMAPLIFLEALLLRHSDPVGLFSKFGVKVTVMHAVFLGLRTLTNICYGRDSWWWNTALFCASLVALAKGYKFQVASAALDVFVLVVAAFSVAMLTEYLGVRSFMELECNRKYMKNDAKCRADAWKTYHFQESFLDGFCNFIELLAFIPACVAMAKDLFGKSMATDASSVSEEHKRQAMHFFAFLVGLYSIEDVLTQIYNYEGLAPLAAHVLHFLLVVDFSIYFLGEIFDSAQFRNRLAEWLPGAFNYCASV